MKLDFLADVPVYVLNGFLLSLFWLWDHLPLLLSLPLGGVFFLFDEEVQRLAARKAGGRGPVRRYHQGLTAFIVLLWLLAASSYPNPVPWLGAAMWLLSVLLIVLLPPERAATLWRCKVSHLTYSLVLLGFRWYLHLVSSTSPYEWATLLGSVDEARRVIGQNVGLFTTIGTWAAWFVLPLGHAAYVVQRLTVHPMSLASPFVSVRKVLEEIRTRGE